MDLNCLTLMIFLLKEKNIKYKSCRKVRTINSRIQRVIFYCRKTQYAWIFAPDPSYCVQSFWRFTITSCNFGIFTSLPIIALHIIPDKALGCALFAVVFRDVTMSFYLLTGWISLLMRQIWWGLG